MKHETDEARLLNITTGTRPDFHEPDEQGITYLGTVGTVLDNARGSSIDSLAVMEGHQEVLVGIQREYPDGSVSRQWFNLATLIGLARQEAVLVHANQVLDKMEVQA